MSTLVSVTNFTPQVIPSGGSVTVDLTYSSPHAGFIVVNEGPSFDATPGVIPIVAGNSLATSVTLKISRQPGATNQECPIVFTLNPSSYTILVGVSP